MQAIHLVEAAKPALRAFVDEVLTPLKASAFYVGMTYAPPLAFFGAMGADADTIAGFAERFRHILDEAALAA